MKIELKKSLALRNNLKSFGLNPYEWKIHRHSKNMALLVHKNMKGFKLKGAIKDNLWESLEIFE